MSTNTVPEEASAQIAIVTLQFQFEFIVSSTSSSQIENVRVVDAVKSLQYLEHLNDLASFSLFSYLMCLIQGINLIALACTRSSRMISFLNEGLQN